MSQESSNDDLPPPLESAMDPVTTSPASSPADASTGAGVSAAEKSKYYFFKSTPAHLAAQYKPQPIANPAAEEASSSTADGPSKWNKGGTWEEKDNSTWARERMETLFVGVELPAGKLQGGSASITKADSVTGDASVVWTRGKKRCSYEMSVTLSWTGEHNGTATSGKVKMPDLDFTNVDDFDIEVTIDASDAAHTAVRAALRSYFPDLLRDRVKVFVDELSQRD